MFLRINYWKCKGRVPCDTKTCVVQTCEFAGVVGVVTREELEDYSSMGYSSSAMNYKEELNVRKTAQKIHSHHLSHFPILLALQWVFLRRIYS